MKRNISCWTVYDSWVRSQKQQCNRTVSTKVELASGFIYGILDFVQPYKYEHNYYCSMFNSSCFSPARHRSNFVKDFSEQDLWELLTTIKHYRKDVQRKNTITDADFLFQAMLATLINCWNKQISWLLTELIVLSQQWSGKQYYIHSFVSSCNQSISVVKESVYSVWME